MWKWFAKLFWRQEPEPSPYRSEYMTTVIVSDTTNVMVTRLGSSVDVIITMGGIVADTSETAEVKFTISDPDTLRNLSALLLNLVPRLEPPYYGEDAIGPLWDDEVADIYEDVRFTVGDIADEWLNSPNMHFALKTPAEVIQSGKAYWVRSVLRSIRTGGFS